MPQAVPELSAKFEDAGDAWRVLSAAGWSETFGVLIPPRPNYIPMAPGVEADALDYLTDEWDYGVLTDDARKAIAEGP